MGRSTDKPNLPFLEEFSMLRYRLPIIMAFWVAAPVALGAQPLKEIASLGARVTRARTASDGTLWLLSSHSDAVRQLASDGSPLAFFSLNRSDGVRPPLLSDFALGGKGNLFALYTEPASTQETGSAVARFEGKIGQAVSIRLDKPVQAWRIELDQEGDMYLLGLEMGIYRQIIGRGGAGEKANLIHRFDALGNWKASYLPVTIPATQPELDARIFNSFGDRANFLVESPGLVWFLQTVPDITRPVWDWERTLYRVTEAGAEPVECQAPTANSFLLGVHRDSGRTVLEWASRSDPESKVLTDTSGNIVQSVALRGLLVACDRTSWYSEISYGPGDRRVFQSKR